MVDALPADVAHALAGWLSPRDRSHFDDVYFHKHARLRLPLEPLQLTTTVATCSNALAGSRRVPTRARVGLASQLAVLKTIGIHDCVARIEIDVSRARLGVLGRPHAVWHGLEGLTGFVRLVHLVVLARHRHRDEPVDLSIIARGAPMLEGLTAVNVALECGDTALGFPHLRQLVLDCATLTSWRFIAESRRLCHVECSWTYPDESDFSLWPALRTLKVMKSNHAELLFNAIETIHLPTLEMLQLSNRVDDDMPQRLNLQAQPSPRLRDLAIPLCEVAGGISTLGLLTQLRSLTLVWREQLHGCLRDHGVVDASPLANLVLLETLKLEMSTRATTCRPLRALVRLRELHLVDGWLRDFVEYLPRLERLTCDEVDRRPCWWRRPERSKTFEKRKGHHDGPLLCGRIRHVAMGRWVHINQYAVELIRHVESLVLEMLELCWDDLSRVNQLASLTALEIKHGGCARGSVCWDGITHTLACIKSLESPKFNMCGSHMTNLPWSLEGVARLRAISLLNVGQGVLEDIAKSSKWLVRLEEFDLQRFNGKSLESLLCLHSLRVIALDDQCNCVRLRGARNVGGALPNLAAIMHNGSDCAWLPTCPLMERSLYGGEYLPYLF